MADVASAVRLIAGLGNPGEKYERTRHNVGIWWLHRIAQEYGGGFSAVRAAQGHIAKIEVADQVVRLFIPDSYVNRSGGPLAAVCNYYKVAPEETLVVHDDLDLPCGVVRLKFSGGSGGHNGVADIRRCIGEGFWRLKIGIGHPGRASEVVSYVLHEPPPGELDAIGDAMYRACGSLEDLVCGEYQRPMKRLHSSEESES